MIQAYGHDVHIVCKNMVFILSFALNKFYKPVRTQCVDVFVISIVVIIVVVSVYRGGARHSSLICASRVSKCHHHMFNIISIMVIQHDHHHHHHLFNRVVVGTVRVGGTGEFEPQAHVCQSKPKRCPLTK